MEKERRDWVEVIRMGISLLSGGAGVFVWAAYSMMAIGLVLLAIAVIGTMWERLPITFSRKIPSSKVFPYIREINAYNAYFNDEAFLSLSVFFPSSITYKQPFKLRATLTLDGRKSEWSEIEDIEITSRAVNRLYAWKFPISQAMLDAVKFHVQDCKPMRASLHIEDFNNKALHWDTEEWTTLLFTKEN